MNKSTFSSDVIFVIASLLGNHMNMNIIYIILNMAAKLALIRLILTVKSKS